MIKSPRLKDLLTKCQFHSHGIKMRLEDDQGGRVQSGCEAD